MTSVAELNELLAAHNCLDAISIQLNEDGMAYDIFLSISVSETEGPSVVRIKFIDISQFTCKNFGGGLTQIMHMSIVKVDSGFDRMRYQFNDVEDEKLSFYFSSYLID